MGRPRKPTRILELNGALKRDPGRYAGRANEPILPKGIGEPPDWLDEFGRAEWERVVPDLETAGVTSRVEATTLACYCAAVSKLRRAEADLARDGLTVMGEVGLKRHPSVATARESMQLIRAFAADFGLTPTSRSRVSAIGPEAEQRNEFAEI